MNFLERIIGQKKKEIADKQATFPLTRLRMCAGGEPVRDFHRAVSGRERIIGEVKKKSPRVQQFRQAADLNKLAPLYERSGAGAVSVVTDSANFGTSLVDAQRIRGQVEIPVLYKDFFIDPYQIHEARVFGADAVLLIARILSGNRLASLLGLTHALGMTAVVETHSRDDVQKAIDVGARVFGINNRNLDTLQVTLDTTRELVGGIPQSAAVVSESGIRHREDIVELSALGVNAFLIGEALLESDDPGTLLSSLLGRREAVSHPPARSTGTPGARKEDSQQDA